MNPKTVDDPIRSALAVAWQGAPNGAECPSDEQLRAASAGELARAEFESVLDHVTGCPACQRVWALAVELAACDVSRAAAAPVAPPRTWVRQVSALAAVLVIAIAIWAATRVPPRGVVLVSETRSDASARIDAARPTDKPLPRAACRLRWTPVPGDARYDLIVTTPALEPIHTVRALSATEYVIPPEALRDLAPASPILWRVEAQLPDGRRIRSATIRSLVE